MLRLTFLYHFARVPADCYFLLIVSYNDI